MRWVIDDRRVGADKHQMVWRGRSGDLGEVVVAERELLCVREIPRYVALHVLNLKACILSPLHPGAVIVARVRRRWIVGMTKTLPISAWIAPKVVIEGMVFFDDDHNVLDNHCSSPGRWNPTTRPHSFKETLPGTIDDVLTASRQP